MSFDPQVFFSLSWVNSFWLRSNTVYSNTKGLIKCTQQHVNIFSNKIYYFTIISSHFMYSILIQRKYKMEDVYLSVAKWKRKIFEKRNCDLCNHVVTNKWILWTVNKYFKYISVYRYVSESFTTHPTNHPHATRHPPPSSNT